MMAWRVPLSDLDYGESELKAVQNVLKTRWLTMGAVTQDFEIAFAEMIGVKHAIAVTNATAGLHLAMLVLGIGPGDEVIVPSLSFVATANAVRYTGAIPVFADVVGERDFNIAPEAIETAITGRTRAVIVMHYGGYVCDMRIIRVIAEDHGLPVVEDAAHAPGASRDGRMAGAWGALGCFSFFSNKNLATGEGGMVTTDDNELADRARLLRSHGMSSLTWDRHKGHAHSYDVLDLGYNYRIDELRSTLGIEQLKKLEAGNARRRQITTHYRERLGAIAEISVPYQDHPGESSAHILPILLDPKIPRGAFMDAMRENGVQTSIHYPPIHRFTAYKDFKCTLPTTEDLAARQVTLPLFPSMTEEQIELVLEAVTLALTSAMNER
jgi:dTDP-4-amino-4,6-dideoxygalactose transaminase